MVMQRTTHPRTLIAIIRDHVEDWRRENAWSRETVADQIVQAHDMIGGPRLTGIAFDPPTRDTFERMRVNADRIFRWLDDATKEKNLLPANFIWSILAALPLERRIHLADDLLHPAGLAVSCETEEGEEPTAQAVAIHFRALVMHTADATVAMSDMVDGIHPGEAERAKKTLSIAGAAIQRARALVDRILKRRKKS